jgi:hypothetical protein
MNTLPEDRRAQRTETLVRSRIGDEDRFGVGRVSRPRGMSFGRTAIGIG